MKPTVLIAELSPLVAGRIASSFRQAGFEVLGQVHDGVSALAKARELRPTVLTLDLIMPRLSGLMVAESLAGPGSPVLVAITTITAQSRVVEAKTAGFRYYVLKPVDAHKLTAAACSISGASHSQHAAM